jgi:hypothetical protein
MGMKREATKRSLTPFSSNLCKLVYWYAHKPPLSLSLDFPLDQSNSISRAPVASLRPREPWCHFTPHCAATRTRRRALENSIIRSVSSRTLFMSTEDDDGDVDALQELKEKVQNLSRSNAVMAAHCCKAAKKIYGSKVAAGSFRFRRLPGVLIITHTVQVKVRELGGSSV